MQLRILRTFVLMTLLALANLFWSTQYIAYKMIDDKALGPVAITLIAFVISMPLMLPPYLIERWRGKKLGLPNAGRERSLLQWSNWSAFVGVGLAMTLATVFTALGMPHTTASNASLLNLTVPVITPLLAAVYLYERMTPARWLSLVIALAGVMVLSYQAPESAVESGTVVDWKNLGAILSSGYAKGNLLVLFGTLASCFYNVGSKGLLSRFTALEVLVYSYLLIIAFSALSLVPLRQTFSLAELEGSWMGLLMLGGFNMGLGQLLWLFLLTRLDVGQASVSVYLMPFFGVVLAACFLHESITWPMVIGGAITLAGTILVVSTENASGGSEASPEK